MERRRKPRSSGSSGSGGGIRGNNNGEDEKDDRKPSALPENADLVDLLLDEDGDDGDDDSFVQVISPTTHARKRTSGNITESPSRDSRVRVGDGAEVWTCPRCTLQNAAARYTCAVCQFDRYSGRVAAASAASASSTSWSGSTTTGRTAEDRRRRNQRSEVIIEDIDVEPPSSPPRSSRQQQSSSSSSSSASSPARYVGGGALLGGMLGAANAYARGRPVGPAAIEGAFAGGIGGAVMNEVMGPAAPPRARDGRSNRDGATGAAVASAATSSAAAASASASPSAFNSNTNGFRLRRTNNQSVTGTFSYGYGYRMGARSVAATPAMTRNPHDGINGLLRSLVGPPGYHGYVDVDRMSYEELLERYGDGTENQRRGATRSQINALPTSTVENAERDLPEDHRTCSICLERFEAGNIRKTLPCLHGFHSECIDQWLETNAQCPICIHKIS